MSKTSLMVLCIIGLMAHRVCASDVEHYETISPTAFKTPQRVFAPHVWWHWMNGNISKEGITADLEAMASQGRPLPS